MAIPCASCILVSKISKCFLQNSPVCLYVEFIVQINSISTILPKLVTAKLLNTLEESVSECIFIHNLVAYVQSSVTNIKQPIDC